MAGNTLVLLSHELGHVLIAEMHLPLLGREEDAADTYAALRMLTFGTSFSQHELAQAAQGWFLNDRRDQEIGEKPLYYDEHNLSQQRAYQILCLMVGSDPDKFKGLADQMKMPEERQRTCKRDFAKTSEGWQTVLKPWLREPGDPETKIDVVYGDGKGMFDGVANMFRSIRFLETVAANSAVRYKWPHPFTLKMESCGHPGTDYDDEARIITICYETPYDFAELYRVYVQPPPVAAAAPARPRARGSANRGERIVRRLRRRLNGETAFSMLGPSRNASVAQPVDENVDQTQHALLPAGLVVHVAHAHEGTNEVLRADVVADLARRDRAVQQPADGPRQLIE